MIQIGSQNDFFQDKPRKFLSPNTIVRIVIDDNTYYEVTFDSEGRLRLDVNHGHLLIKPNYSNSIIVSNAR